MVIALTPVDLVTAVALMLTSAGLSLFLSLGFHKGMVWASIRMVVQLLLVGSLLRLVFRQDSAALTVLIFLAMLTAAAHEVGARQPRRLQGGWRHLINGAAVSMSTIFVSAFALVTVLGADNWLEPAHAIPIGGIILGTAMNSASIALNALLSNIGNERDAIEAQLALGGSRFSALSPLMRRAVNAGIIPVMNQMVGAGIITMPGIMSGQILAGQDPLNAATYQVFLMLLLAASGTASAIFAVYFTVFRLSDERHRLRLDRLEDERRPKG
ncbi:MULTISPECIES: iron export ABC transporter permease subunit FetB [Rhizobiaceae]|uniref:ABC transporter permease n=1 Tax=Rhizobiaceae TaxID=82115 RepID=UPI001AD48BE5|nr:MULTISPECIES: iron export ABC transporter permease subunit FetB [Rhizobiaceae]MBN9034194.1 iron export ABC transporter permease subunit FetB [Hyphomicrobiales bacterium]MBN9052854.1 iron export ABC transporter permease subunit FetB [Hyphomicrobiales bacterium]MDG3580308.1 iron export ABC transporter permease subunit FetB [Rhizobium sp. YJ-22]